jgi:exonuclease VII small subunit
MGFRFRKSVRLAPGLRVNFGKTGTSLSVGGRGATTTISKRGVRNSISVPGTGVGYSTMTPWREPERKRRRPEWATAPAGASNNDVLPGFEAMLADLDEVVASLDQPIMELDKMLAAGVKAQNELTQFEQQMDGSTQEELATSCVQAVHTAKEALRSRQEALEAMRPFLGNVQQDMAGPVRLLVQNARGWAGALQDQRDLLEPRTQQVLAGTAPRVRQGFLVALGVTVGLVLWLFIVS